ncbi:hypothetical protein GCM10009133_11810 [Cocleimonas flava]|uniref:Uncharacterized protein n=1 Tax=Cocleimonas flava TaxID=634765 RepID=A0A4R1F040_9GAMM|nr:MetJ regulator of methionine regulon [Cocleimonas flava]TCJ87546.1 hypothetical protein EV695_2057 [Cocleimonas flava]
MESFKILLLIAGSISILFGYLRFLPDEEGNIDLNNYRFTGGLGLVIRGTYKGTHDLLLGKISSNAISALALYVGIILFIIGFKI